MIKKGSTGTYYDRKQKKVLNIPVAFAQLFQIRHWSYVLKFKIYKIYATNRHVVEKKSRTKLQRMSYANWNSNDLNPPFQYPYVT